MMIRRFVNIVAENYKSSMYSLHGLDVSKHLFYPSTAEAEAAAAKAAASKKNGNGGGRPPVIPRLRRLPAPYMSFQPSPTTLGDSTTMGTFALVSPRSSEGRILCSSDAGHSLLYNADSHFIQTMPSVQGFIGSRPITISTGRPGALEDDLYILRDGAGLSCFHVLRFGSKDRLVHRPSGRKGWHWESLPRPPFSGIINSYTVVDGGRTICVSYNAPDFFGTYCFDTVEREWWEAGDWVLPFEGGAEYVPDLKLWLGFSPSKPHHLCATSDLSAMDQPPTLQHVLPDLDTPENWSAMRFNPRKKLSPIWKPINPIFLRRHRYSLALLLPCGAARVKVGCSGSSSGSGRAGLRECGQRAAAAAARAVGRPSSNGGSDRAGLRECVAAGNGLRLLGRPAAGAAAQACGSAGCAAAAARAVRGRASGATQALSELLSKLEAARLSELERGAARRATAGRRRRARGGAGARPGEQEPSPPCSAVPVLCSVHCALSAALPIPSRRGLLKPGSAVMVIKGMGGEDRCDKGTGVAGASSTSGAAGRSTATDGAVEVVTQAADWWDSYGGEHKELQKIARRIVSQCMSSSGCERNWSTFAMVHTKLRNRLGYEKLHKLVYVHYNLKLRIQHFVTDMQSLQEIQGSKERDSDPCSIMMDVAMYDEGNPIMDWLCNSRSESTPILDEYVDNEPESPSPSRFLIDELGMDEEEVAIFKRKLEFGRKGGKKKGKVGLKEDEEGIADDFESDSSQGSPTYAESGDNSSDDAGCGTDDDAGCGTNDAAGARREQPTSIRPRSTRQKKLSIKGLYLKK
ncbi:uncharacterized protein LOC133891187 [Phragmites australis]|uniref:uncharacterized protein LOC133891187 n=1 Tax=Phragmites australis TaxID=29695 RepID=UPI002D774EAB|nr:uncharacterized protein LOC133891187 [Phragmites australis]